MRRLWLHTNGLFSNTKKPLDVVAIIKKLGFVQLDTIQNVSRAHHHILWSRHAEYREYMLDELLSAREHIFEHFTHDASVLPMEVYPLWSRRFNRLKAQLKKASYHRPDRINEWKDHLIKRIREEGPLSTKDFNSKRSEQKKVWSSPPHKQVLDYLWYTGALATSHREKFTKFYDLADRVIPEHIRTESLTNEEQINKLCLSALSKLAVATPKEIKEFWDAVDIKEVKTWLEANERSLVLVQWETNAGKWINSYALDDIEERIQNLPDAKTQLKIINPFDPAVRNRTRLSAMFGFDYKLEVFVPEAKRQWGYYVYPILEGDKFIGRIEVKADRKAKKLNVINLWQEPNNKWKTPRTKRLKVELQNFSRLAGLETVSGLK